MKKTYLTLLLIAASAAAFADTFALSHTDDRSESNDIQTWNLPGTYRATDSSGKRLTIDETLRIRRHSLSLVNQVTGQESRIQFPHRLRKMDEDNLFTTTGQVTVHVLAGGMYRPCNLKVQFQGDSYQEGNALDVTLRFPKSVTVDIYGQCVGLGTTTSGFGYTKENEGKK